MTNAPRKIRKSYISLEFFKTFLLIQLSYLYDEGIDRPNLTAQKTYLVYTSQQLCVIASD